MNESVKLTTHDKRELVIQAGMQLIPYVGGPLVSLYFGAKQEVRFKRLETFYEEVASEITKIKFCAPAFDALNAESLQSIFELLHEKIEVESMSQKRILLKNYFLNTLKIPIGDSFDERKYFLDSLSEMTLLECDLLRFIYSQQTPIQVGNIQWHETDKYAVIGAIGRLKSRGFLTSMHEIFSVGAVPGGDEDNSLLEIVSVSSFGKSFISFCLED